MKILFKAPASNPHTQKWATALKKRGHSIIVFSPLRGYIPGVEVITCPQNYNSQSATKLLQKIKMIRQFRKLYNDFDPDIVHVHYLPVGWANYISNFGLNNIIISVWGSDIVWNCHENGSEPLKYRLYKRLQLTSAREISSTSNYLSLSTQKYISPRKPISIIPFGVDTSFFKRKTRIDQNKSIIRIGFIKHLEPKYGPDILINSYQIIFDRYPNTELIIVGKGSLESKLKDMTIKLGIQKHVKFLGYIPYDKIISIYESIDIFAMPSIYESFGVAALEAQSMQIPVVASRTGGIPEAVVDGITGILVHPENPKALADGILKLIENRELRFHMGNRGREFVKKKYEWRKSLDQMEKLYSQI